VSTEQPQDGGHKKPPIPTPAKKVPAYNIEKRGDRLYQAQTLHKWFAISSLLLFLFTVGTVMQDYTREWKGYQRQFNQIAVRYTRDDRQDAADAVDRDKYSQIRSDLKAAEEAQKANKGAISEAEEKVAAINAKWIGVDQNYRFTKAGYDAEKYAYEEALAHNAENKDKLKAKLDATQATMDGYFLEREQINTELSAAKEALNKLQSKTIEDQKQLESMKADYERLTRQLNTLNPGKLVTSIINAPLMDFMRPSLQIKQILLPNLFYDQPFKQISRADRCTTCHLGIDNKKFESEEQPFKTHPNMEMYLGANSPHPMEKFGCTSCHGGLDRSTNFLTAGHTPKDKAQREEWEFKYGWDPELEVLKYLDTPMLPMGRIEAGCYKCHNNSPEVPKAPALANGRELIKQFGCFGCHKIPGYEGIGKVGPDLSTVSGKLTKDWVKKWLANPKDFKSEARMPKFWYNSNNTGVINGVNWDKRNVAEINAIVEYLWSKSTPKTLPTKSANGDAKHGKELVESRGCYGCHSVGPIEETGNKLQTRRRHGYNLASQGSKVTANWIANWVQDPQQVWADSKMPSLRLPDSEVADVAAYLSSLKNLEWEKKTPPATETAELDKVVFEFLRAGSTEAKAKTALAAMSLEQKNLYAGEKLVGRYGCYGCHNVPGFEKAQPIGTELTEAGSKLVSQLDFGFLPIEHNRAEWYTQKLHNPRVFDEGRVKRPEEMSRMPNFTLSDKDVDSIVMVLVSMVKDPVPLDMKDRTDPEVAEGRQLVEEKNCRGCHIIETMGGDIRAIVKDNLQWPPNLATQGQKTQPTWLRDFLKDPGAERPRWWMDTRMPSFHFTEHQIAVIGKYFAKRDKVDWGWIDTTVDSTPDRLAAGKALFEELKCIGCHPTSPVVKLEEGKAPAPNLGLAHSRLRPEWVVRWITDPSAIVPDTRMPTFFAKDDVTGKRKGFLRTGETADKAILKGEAEAQIQAIRDYVFTLGGGSTKAKNGN